MTPKSGQAGTLVAPVEPKEAIDASNAEPGASSRPEQEGPGDHTSDPTKTSWIEIELLDQDDKPVAGERFAVTTPDGRIARGTLDQNGFARIEGIDPGTCQVTFPRLDGEAWEPA